MRQLQGSSLIVARGIQVGVGLPLLLGRIVIEDQSEPFVAVKEVLMNPLH